MSDRGTGLCARDHERINGDGSDNMADPSSGAGAASPGDGGKQAAGSVRIPAMQKLLDNPFLLLFLGVTVPTVFYVMWGIMEVAQIPIAK